MSNQTAVPSLFEAFGVESPNTDTRQIPLDRVAPMGNYGKHEPKPFVFEYASLRRTLMNIAEGKPLWIWGESGCGKTEFIIQIARRLKRPVFVVPFGEETSVRELLGTHELVSSNSEATEEVTVGGMNGLIAAIMQLAKKGFGARTKFRYGQLVQALRTPGSIIVLDEFPMAPAGVTAQFNYLLETGELTIPETGEVIKAADGVTFVATANTPGSMDESGVYVGNQVQNGALRSRFAGLKVTYLPPKEEEKILHQNFPKLNAAINMLDGKKTTSEMMVGFGNEVRSLVKNSAVSLPFTVRNLKEWANSSLKLRDMTEGFRNSYYDLLSPREAVPVAELYFKRFAVKLESDTSASAQP